MYSAPRSILAVAVVFISGLTETVSFAQGINFIRHAADPLPVSKTVSSRVPCTNNSRTTTAAGGDADVPCDAPPVSVPSLNPCNPATLPQIGCTPATDPVHENLAAMGKPGQKILRARDRVLEILQSENACSAWFRQKDPNPAAAFQTLGFAIDRHGEEVIHVSKGAASEYFFRDPYVAKVGQDIGAFSTITLNAGGAFFRALATTVAVSKEGGLSTFEKPRLINVGPYPGDSLDARTLALLHEFGHVLNLLPRDFDNEDGRSMQNTVEVLRFCRAEVESKVRRSTLAVRR